MKTPLNSKRSGRVVPACAMAVFFCVAAIWIARAQNQLGVGKDFTFPDYYPSTNGLVRLRSIITGKEYRFLSNNVLIALTQPRIKSYREDGKTLEWSAIARDATVDINTREVRGTTNLFFRTADDTLFLSGVGFLWQQSNSVLILSNKTFTWIDTQRMTNTSSKNRMNKMKMLAAATLVATSELTAAEMEIPPARPGLTITADINILMLKSNIVIFSNNVVVIDPPAKPGDAPMILKCVWLTGRRDAFGKIEEIEAHERVEIDHGTVHARGNYARYSATNELIALVGMFDPKDVNNTNAYLYTVTDTNSFAATTNSGDAIIYDRARNMLSTLGNTRLVVPGAALKSTSPFEAGSRTNRVPKTP